MDIQKGSNNHKRPNHANAPKSQPDLDDSEHPMAKLMQILVPSERPGTTEYIKKLDQSLAHIEQQITDPVVSIERLVPSIAEIIARKVTEGPEEIAQAIAPIVDDAIAKRTQQDKMAIVRAIAPVVAEAISGRVRESPEDVASAIAPIVDDAIAKRTQQDKMAIVRAIAPVVAEAISGRVRESPEDIASAIGPEIASAIQAQHRIDPEALVNALYPIIDRIIEYKIQEDKRSMSAAIAPVVPPAIAKQIKDFPQEVATAIAPEMATAIKQQIMLEREAMVDALYPVIGSTIAKSIAQTMRDINQKVENALSPEGIQRKIRAKVQGISEAELILKETMPWTVRAIFLIEKNTGLVMSDIQQSGEQKLESDMVAGMLTAIRSFVGEYIAESGRVSEIDEINYGKSKIVLEVAGYCYLAVVIDGEPSKLYMQKIRATFCEIVHNYSTEIQAYDGDRRTIPTGVHRLLEGLMVNELKKERKRPPAIALLALTFLGFILVPWAIHQYRNGIDRRIAAEVNDALASAPELSVYRLNGDVHRGTLKLTGWVSDDDLRHQAEQIAHSVAPTQAIENQIVSLEVLPNSTQAEAEVARIETTLNQMDGISISAKYNAGQVMINGTIVKRTDAPKITQAFDRIPGVISVTNTVEVEPLTIPNRIYFKSASSRLNPADMDTKILHIETFMNRYPEMNLKIVGHSDRKGNPQRNQQLALQRAEAVKKALEAKGIDPNRLQIQGKPEPPNDVASFLPDWVKRVVVLYPIESNADEE